MMQIIKLEWLKFSKNTTIRILVIFYIIFFPLGFLFAKEIKEMLPEFISSRAQILEFPAVWDYMGYGGSYLVFFFLGVVMIYITGLEVRYKTMRQSIINGMTRNDFFKSKLLMMFVISFFATVYYFIVCSLIGFTNTANPLSSFSANLIMVPRYFLMCVGYLSFATLLVFWLRKSGLAMFLYFSYILIIESVLRWGVHFKLAKNKFVNYYPLESISDLVPNPIWNYAEALPNKDLDFSYTLESNTAIPLALFYIIVFIGLSYYSFYKRDI